MESSHCRGPLGPGRLPFAAQSFAIGETGCVKNEYVSGHVRVPAYIRGKTGTIVHVSTPTPFPGAAGHNMQAEMEPTYDVRFRASDLSPDTSDEALNHVAVFQSYLEKVESEPSRVYRRLHSLRGWGHGETEPVFPGGAGASGADGVRAHPGPRVAVDGDHLDRREDRVCGRDAAELGATGRA